MLHEEANDLAAAQDALRTLQLSERTVKTRGASPRSIHEILGATELPVFARAMRESAGSYSIELTAPV